MTQEVKKPLCEAICDEIDAHTALIGYESAKDIIRKHFASLTVEQVAMAIYSQNRTVVDGIFDGRLEGNKVLSWEECKRHVPADAKASEDTAQAVMKLLRKD